jgi:hypothetical protein
MTIKQTIELIDQELSQILNDYSVWIEESADLLSYSTEVGKGNVTIRLSQLFG